LEYTTQHRKRNTEPVRSKGENRAKKSRQRRAPEKRGKKKEKRKKWRSGTAVRKTIYLEDVIEKRLA